MGTKRYAHKPRCSSGGGLFGDVYKNFTPLLYLISQKTDYNPSLSMILQNSKEGTYKPDYENTANDNNS